MVLNIVANITDTAETAFSSRYYHVYRMNTFTVDYRENLV